MMFCRRNNVETKMKKILMMASLVTMVGAAHGECTSAVNGFYGVLKLGITGTIAKVKTTTKKINVTGKEVHLHSTMGLLKDGVVEGLTLKQEEELAAWMSMIKKCEEIARSAPTEQTAAEATAAAAAFAAVRDLNPGVVIMEESAETSNLMSMFKKAQTQLESVGLELQLDDKRVALDDRTLYAVLCHGDTDTAPPTTPSPPPDVQAQPAPDDDSGDGNQNPSHTWIVLKVPAESTLRVVRKDTGATVHTMTAHTYGALNPDMQARGVVLVDLDTDIIANSTAETKIAGMLDQQLAGFVGRIVQDAVNSTYLYKMTPGPVVFSSDDKPKERTEELKAVTKTVAGHKNHFTVGGCVGYQHAIGAFYTGLELGAEFTPGKVNVRKSEKTFDDTDKNLSIRKQQHLSFRYPEAVPSVQPKVSLKTKYSIGITPMLGITAGNWLFYVPITLKLTKYELLAERGKITEPSRLPGITLCDLENLNLPILLFDPKFAVADSTTTTGTETTAATHAESAEKTATEKGAIVGRYKKGKTKFGIEFGAGARFFVTPHLFLGLRYTYSPRVTMKFSTPKYDTKLLHDPYRYGAEHKVSVSSHKGMLEVGYKF
jgi:opacity protein-like surface antigen